MRRGFFLVILLGALSLAFGIGYPSDLQNLSVNKEATERIGAMDRAFFHRYEVYSAGVREAPTALLFDLKGDNYHLPCRFWGEPLKEDEIIYAIKRLQDQYVEPIWCLTLPPRALNIVNKRGEILGFIYTSMDEILMRRKRNGEVTVFLPILIPADGGGFEPVVEGVGVK